jgi:16S rRNA (guanine(966)-N(2))-methyltransferase RsmD
MRIVGGHFKGKTFRTKIPKNIRPTSDFVREAIFDILTNLINLNGKNVLDLFAGTGMLGIEALSRGASFCHFVDKSKTSSNIILSNLESLSIDRTKYKVTLADVFSFLRTYQNERKFDVIFADPPYNSNLSTKLINDKSFVKIAQDGTIFVVETSKQYDLKDNEFLKLLKKKEYGDTTIYFFSL